MRPRLRLLLAVLVAVAAPLLCGGLWSRVERPGVPLLAVAGASFAALAVLAGRLRPVAVVCASTLLTLALVEGGLELRSRRRAGGLRGPGSAPLSPFARRDPVLGWTGRPGRHPEGGPIQGAFRTIGPDGFRVGSGRAGSGTPVALVLGDSYAFGYKLPDDRTVPFVLEERLAGRLDVASLAMSGWGPHQTLALLELGLERRLVGGRPIVFGAYFAQADALRPTGRLRHLGPAYVLEDDRLRLAGTLEDLEPLRDELARRTALGERAGRLLWPRRADHALYVALLLRLATLFERRHHAPLVFVLQDAFDEAPVAASLRRSATIGARLRAAGLDVVSYASLFPPGEFGRYRIPDDGHPTAEGAARVAAYLVERIGSLDRR